MTYLRRQGILCDPLRCIGVNITVIAYTDTDSYLGSSPTQSFVSTGKPDSMAICTTLATSNPVVSADTEIDFISTANNGLVNTHEIMTDAAVQDASVRHVLENLTPAVNACQSLPVGGFGSVLGFVQDSRLPCSSYLKRPDADVPGQVMAEPETLVTDGSHANQVQSGAGPVLQDGR